MTAARAHTLQLPPATTPAKGAAPSLRVRRLPETRDVASPDRLEAASRSFGPSLRRHPVARLDATRPAPGPNVVFLSDALRHWYRPPLSVELPHDALGNLVQPLEVSDPSAASVSLAAVHVERLAEDTAAWRAAGRANRRAKELPR